MSQVIRSSERELTFIRVINAPRALVWEAWTDPEHIKQWWGPTGFTSTIHQMDVCEGGTFRLTMHGPDGTDFPNRIVYEEVLKPERLVYAHGSEEQPGLFHVEVTFTDLGGKTEITMKMTFKTKEELDKVEKKYGAIEGNKQTMARLEAYLAKNTINSVAQP